MIKVFLSASIPLPDRHQEFFKSADVVAIKDAIKALVEVVIPDGQIVFGGHPAITPLIALLLRAQGDDASKRVVLYQSNFFAKNFSKDNDSFLDVRFIEEVDNSREKSLEAMRSSMIRDTDFDAGVFIGGMEGVIEEYEMFSKLHPHAPKWPIASTGGAALKVYNSSCSTEELSKKYNLLLREMTYPTLFRSLIKTLK